MSELSFFNRFATGCKPSAHEHVNDAATREEP